MIIGMGIDIVETSRVRRAVENERFLSRVYTEVEQAYCRSQGAQAVQSFAARFAAKEAVMKAFGVGLWKGEFTDIEVLPEESGRPVLHLHGWFARRADALGVTAKHISLSHTKAYGAANCILEGKT